MTKTNPLKKQRPTSCENELSKDINTYKIGNIKFRVKPVYKEVGNRNVVDALIALLTSDDK
jgi:hypothetical protein